MCTISRILVNGKYEKLEGQKKKDEQKGMGVGMITGPGNESNEFLSEFG